MPNALNERTIPTITNADQIKDLPWAGNHFSDWHLFESCHNYIVAEDTAADEKKKALYEMGLHGMGFDEEVTNETLQQYLEDSK